MQSGYCWGDSLQVRKPIPDQRFADADKTLGDSNQLKSIEKPKSIENEFPAIALIPADRRCKNHDNVPDIKPAENCVFVSKSKDESIDFVNRDRNIVMG